MIIMSNSNYNWRIQLTALTDLKRDGSVEFSHKPVGVVKEGDREQDEGEEGEGEEKEDVGEGEKGEEEKEGE